MVFTMKGYLPISGSSIFFLRLFYRPEIKVQKNHTFRGCCLFFSGQGATEKVARVITFKTKHKEELDIFHMR